MTELKSIISARPVCHQCGKPAVVEVHYGTYGTNMNGLELCGECSDGLWGKVKIAVGHNLMHWVNRKIERGE